VADIIPDVRLTKEPVFTDEAPLPRRRSRKTLAWTGTAVGVAVTAAVLTALFVTSGTPASLSSPPVGTPPSASGATLSDPGGTRVAGVAFSPDGNWLAIGHVNGSAYLWHPVTQVRVGQSLRHVPDDAEVGSVALSSADMLAVGTGNRGSAAGGVTLWNARTRGYLMTLREPGGAGTSGGLAFSPDGIYLIAHDGNGAIYRWNVYMGMPPAILHDPGTGKVFDVAFQPGTHIFAVADGNGSVYLWDATNSVQYDPPFHDPGSKGVRGVSFSPDGTLLAAGDANGNVYIWKVATGRLLQTLHDPQGLQVNDVSFSPDGTAVAAAGNNSAQTASAIRVWILATQQARTLHDPNTKGAFHLAFSPDGSLLAAGDANGNTYLWDMLWLRG
jgi:WD40 repeat protein